VSPSAQLYSCRVNTVNSAQMVRRTFTDHQSTAEVRSYLRAMVDSFLCHGKGYIRTCVQVALIALIWLSAILKLSEEA
jgi:hypothetical protein